MAKLSVNQVNLLGSAGKDMDVKIIKDIHFGEFSMATNEYNSKKKESETTWHTIKVIGKLAESLNGKILKGSDVFVTGKIKVESWDKDGVKQYKTVIIADYIKVTTAQKSDDNSGSDSNDSSDDTSDLPF